MTGNLDRPVRPLLTAGILVGPLFLATGILQGLLRDGFHFARHPLSVLAQGAGGWIQTANFVLGAALVLAAAVGLARVLQPNGRWTSLFLGAYGLSMLVAALFPADPVDGFPVGTPLGPPTTITPVGLTHFAAGTLGFVALAISCFCAARALSRQGHSGLARLSLASGVIILAGFFGGFFLPSPVIGIWVTVVVGWAWLSLISARLRPRS